MKPNGKIAAVVVLSCAVVGCSKRGDAKKTTAQLSTPNSVSSLSGSPAAGMAIDDEWFVGTPSPTVKWPVSFADGEAAFQSKNYGEATTLFAHYGQRRPDNPWGHYMLG